MDDDRTVGGTTIDKDWHPWFRVAACLAGSTTTVKARKLSTRGN